VNLITGKNDTGKSSVLEAVAVYASKGDFPLITQLLSERGEFFPENDSPKDLMEANVKILSSLFTNREISFDPDKGISIGPVNSTLFGDETIPNNGFF
jgi:AAA15 family ATPase/GTPase